MFLLSGTSALTESANCVPYVPTCQCALRTYVPTCLACLRAHVPTCFVSLRLYVSTCLACLHSHVPTCLACLRAQVSCVSKCSRAITLNNKNKFSMTCFTQIFDIFSLSFPCEIKFYMKSIYDKQECLWKHLL